MGKFVRIITLSMLVFLASTFAAVLMVEATGSFTVAPVFPDNQNREVQFFDINVVPGTRQELAVEVSNSADEDITVELNIITASTNREGIVEYSLPGLRDETMLHALSDITTFPGLDENREVVIPAGSSVVIPILIDIPEEGFDGIILGAVHVLLGITEEERAAAGMIVNRFANVKVIRLENRGIITDTEFILGNVSAEIVNQKAAVVAEIRNPLARLVMGVNADFQVYLEGDNAPVFSKSNVSVDFAPNSIFPFSLVDTDGYGLHPGVYIARIQLEHQGETWEFEREFEISPEEAAGINFVAVNVDEQRLTRESGSNPTGNLAFGNLLWLMIAVGVGAVLVVAVSSFLIVKSITSKDREWEDSDSERNDGMDYLRHEDPIQYNQQDQQEVQNSPLMPPPQPIEQNDRYEQNDRPVEPQKISYELNLPVEPDSSYKLNQPLNPQEASRAKYRPQDSQLNQPIEPDSSYILNQPFEPQEANRNAKYGAEDSELNQLIEPENSYRLNRSLDSPEASHNFKYSPEDSEAERKRLLEEQMIQQREKEELRRFIIEQRRQKREQEQE